MRMSASAPRMLSEATSILGWYHSSSQLACSASVTSTGGLGGASAGSRSLTRSRRSPSLNGVGSSGSMARPSCMPMPWIAVTMGEAGGPNTSTLPP